MEYFLEALYTLIDTPWKIIGMIVLLIFMRGSLLCYTDVVDDPYQTFLSIKKFEE